MRRSLFCGRLCLSARDDRKHHADDEQTRSRLGHEYVSSPLNGFELRYLRRASYAPTELDATDLPPGEIPAGTAGSSRKRPGGSWDFNLIWIMAGVLL